MNLGRVFQICKTIVRVLTRCIVVSVMIVNLVFVIGLANLYNDLDIKTDMMASAFIDYHKITVETLTLLIKGQLMTDGFVKDLQAYLYEKNAIIEQEIKDKTLMPNFVNLVKSNVLIYNQTQGCSGSGTIIEYKGQVYILSVAHLDAPSDTFFVKENNEMRLIRLVRTNHAVDLALFKYVEKYDDLVIAKLADEEPNIGDKVWAIGNPAMLEDAVTNGNLVKKIEFHYLINAKIYYGSSGGGLFNVKGELIGVNAQLKGAGDFVLGVSVNLNTIKLFLRGQIPNDMC